MSSTVRPYQLCVFGATGFTGRLVCERIATEYPNAVRFAIAGRDRGKLESVRDEMLSFNPSLQDIGLVIADSSDPVSIDSLTRSTDVIISCAGPYRKYSEAIVQSSVKNKTHYLDLTAEVNWIRSNIERFHDEALKNKTKIIHSCGYDCVPMDLGTLFVVDTIRKRYNKDCRLVENYFVSGFGGFSGGTAASLFDIMDTTPQDILNDPKMLCSDYFNVRSGEAFPGANYNEALKTWMIPLMFAKVNTPVVYRSNALAETPYGQSFVYREGIKADNIFAAYFCRGLNKFTELATQPSMLQGLFRNFAPASGSGPSKTVQRKLGYWKHLFVGYPEDGSSNPSDLVYLKMEDNSGDPGYWSTSKMLLECALSLVFDKDQVDAANTIQGG
eukprot:g8721.t1